MSIWTLAMFFISGLDIVIVGHYQYKDTGFYAIANAATNVMLAVISSVFGPSFLQFRPCRRPARRASSENCASE